MTKIHNMKRNMNGKYALVVCPNPSIDVLAWIKSFKHGQPNRIIKEERYPGGKGIHVAMALAELGVEVVVIGFWGSVVGEWIKNECNSYYPKIKFEGPILEEWSRSCFTFKPIMPEDHFDDTEILGPGPNLTAKDIMLFNECVGKFLLGAKVLALSGSWPNGSPEDGYRKFIAVAKRHNVPSFVDCTGNQLEQVLNERPYCVHLNRKEITTYFKTNDFDEAKIKLLALCEVAAITDGSNGLHYFSEDITAHSLAKVDHVISTVGSGDCLLAGIIAGHMKQMNHYEIAKLGAACGAANCIRKELGLLFHEDVKRLFREAEVF